MRSNSSINIYDMKRELTFKNEEQELTRVTEFMENICDELQLDTHVAMKLQVAIEEMVTNVIFYAYPEGTSADITLSAESDDKELFSHGDRCLGIPRCLLPLHQIIDNVLNVRC